MFPKGWRRRRACARRWSISRDANGGIRVLPDSFMTIRQAMATLAGNAAAHAYLEGFIAEQKASGFVARELAASGRGNVRVAP